MLVALEIVYAHYMVDCRFIRHVLSQRRLSKGPPVIDFQENCVKCWLGCTFHRPTVVSRTRCQFVLGNLELEQQLQNMKIDIGTLSFGINSTEMGRKSFGPALFVQPRATVVCEGLCMLSAARYWSLLRVALAAA